MEKQPLNADRFNLKFVGLEDTKLKPEQKEQLKELVKLETQKIEREIPHNFDVIIHIKEYEKQSKKQRYALILKIESPGQVYTSEHSQKDAWDIKAAVRSAFDNIKIEIMKKRRTN